MEVTDAYRLDPRASQFLLAAAVQRELGERTWPRTALGAGLAVSSRLFDCGSASGVLADSLGTRAVDGNAKFFGSRIDVGTLLRSLQRRIPN